MHQISVLSIRCWAKQGLCAAWQIKNVCCEECATVTIAAGLALAWNSGTSINIPCTRVKKFSRDDIRESELCENAAFKGESMTHAAEQILLQEMLGQKFSGATVRNKKQNKTA